MLQFGSDNYYQAQIGDQDDRVEDNFIYSDLKFKARSIKIRSGVDELHGSILDLIALGNQTTLTSEKIINALCNDLREILKKEDISSLIQGIFSIESSLHELKKIKSSDHDDFILDFSRLYQKLSPIILRAILEGVSPNKDCSAKCTKMIKEAIRVAVEEELYLLQDSVL